jgi:chromosome segregation ATPase
MIDIHIQASSAAEALNELRDLAGETPELMNQEQYAMLCARSLEANKKVDAADEEIDKLMDEVADLKNELAGKEQRIAALTDLVSKRDAELAKLEKELGAAMARIGDNDDVIAGLIGNIEEADKIIADLRTRLEDAANEMPETPDPNQIEAYPETEEGKEYKKEDVRAVLVQAREKGINIAEILSNFGGTLGAVKEEDYPALVEDVRDAIADKEEK